MRFPELLTFADILQQLEKFNAIIDVRSPAEFAEDHLPGAINCPVLNDEERIRIGTLYKQVNAFEAKKLGAALVARNIAQHIESQFLIHEREWRPLIYCWRGGNRSGAMAHILSRIGWPVAQLDGGYKEYRRHVNAALETLPTQFDYRVLCGPTGSGKSRMLQVLHKQGAQVLDLEQLAAHRGSILGHIPNTPQPSQKAFESAIWQQLQQFNPKQPIYIESESRKVGNLRVPDAMMNAMRAAPCIVLELPLAERIKLLMRDYEHFIANTTILNEQIGCLTALHGREKIQRWQDITLAGEWEQLVLELLRDHYDPSYQRSIARNFLALQQAHRVVLESNKEADFHTAAKNILCKT